MTDYDKLKSILDEFGVGYKEEPDYDKQYIMCIEGESKIKGCGMFYTYFEFNSNDSFDHMGAGE